MITATMTHGSNADCPSVITKLATRCPGHDVGSMCDGLKILTDHGSHTFLTPTGAANVMQLFGVKLKMQSVRANTGNPKELQVDGAKRNAKVEGYSCFDLAQAIAELLPDNGPSGKLPREYHNKFGRGSAFWAAVETIRVYLDVVNCRRCDGIGIVGVGDCPACHGSGYEKK